MYFVSRSSRAAIFDIAYQGFGIGVNEDAYAVRYFEAMAHEMLVCQSFSKKFALYGERCGALHVACLSEENATSVHNQLRFLIRSELSSSPTLGARLIENVSQILGKRTCGEWVAVVFAGAGKLTSTSILTLTGVHTQVFRGRHLERSAAQPSRTAVLPSHFCPAGTGIRSILVLDWHSC
jgi:hypothetical protein